MRSNRRGRIPRATAAVVAIAAMCLTITPTHADSIRSGEWPLDQRHFDADHVWALSRGTGVTVAVIDSGVSASHPDLTGQVLPGTSLLGDNGDGRTDTSSDSHGTAIAGIIAGTGGPNGTGMAGLAPGAKILPVRVSPDGTATTQAIAQGIVWAADHDAQVINLSLGSPNPDPLLKKAVTYALGKDVILVASAGNQGDSGNAAMYPAAFPGVISVSGVNQDDTFWSPSESRAGITIAGPAADIYSTNDQGQYVHAEGTSYAAAYVTATAALLRSRFPQLTAGQLIQRLIKTTRQHHDEPDARLGYGILNPLAALTTDLATTDPGNPLLNPRPATPQPDNMATVITAIAAAAAVLAAIATGVLLRRRRRAVASTPPPSQPTGGNLSRRTTKTGSRPTAAPRNQRQQRQKTKPSRRR